MLASVLLLLLLAKAYNLAATKPLDNIAEPGLAIWTEMGAAVAAFLGLMWASRRGVFRDSRPARALRRRVALPVWGAVPLGAATALCFGAFALFAAMDFLGGYEGPMSSLLSYPALRAAYYGTGASWLGFWPLGVVASLCFALAVAGATVLLARGGVWEGAKDSLTLLAAPAAAVFELGIWYNAPEDMTWHFTSYLWLGGINDLGHRSVSMSAGVTYYLLNNWLVLTVALLLVASRVPGLFDEGSRGAQPLGAEASPPGFAERDSLTTSPDLAPSNRSSPDSTLPSGFRGLSLLASPRNTQMRPPDGRKATSPLEKRLLGFSTPT